MIFDVIIIGAGPAGLTAAIYSARYKLKTLVLENKPGHATYATPIENYPGFDQISGLQLMEKIKKQALRWGAEIKNAKIIDIFKKDNFIIKTENQEFYSRAVILAFGNERRKLNIGEEKFIGKGVSYCATCDAPLFKNKDVAVVGGSNAAIMYARLLAKYAKKVILIYRGKELRADPARIQELQEEKNIEIMLNSNIKKIDGKVLLESLTLEDGKKLNVQGLFIEIGNSAITHLTKNLKLKTDEENYFIVDEERKTNIPGVFAAGDCVSKKLRQIVTAVSDGASAAHSVYEFLKKETSKSNSRKL